MGFLDFFKKKKTLTGFDLLLSQFEFAGGTGAQNDPIRIVPIDRESAFAAINGPLAELLSPPGAPPQARSHFARGYLVKLLKDGFFQKRYGAEGHAWSYGMHALMQNHIELQEIVLKGGSKSVYYFDFSSLVPA